MARRKTSQSTYSEVEADFVQQLAEKLPPIIARKKVELFLGGVIAMQTLSNADAAGTGPEIAYRIGRDVAYVTDSLLHWLVKHKGISKLANIKQVL